MTNGGLTATIGTSEILESEKCLEKRSWIVMIVVFDPLLKMSSLEAQTCCLIPAIPRPGSTATGRSERPATAGLEVGVPVICFMSQRNITHSQCEYRNSQKDDIIIG